jgi:hypothetical protein
MSQFASSLGNFLASEGKGLFHNNTSTPCASHIGCLPTPTFHCAQSWLTPLYGCFHWKAPTTIQLTPQCGSYQGKASCRLGSLLSTGLPLPTCPTLPNTRHFLPNGSLPSTSLPQKRHFLHTQALIHPKHMWRRCPSEWQCPHKGGVEHGASVLPEGGVTSWGGKRV